MKNMTINSKSKLVLCVVTDEGPQPVCEVAPFEAAAPRRAADPRSDFRSAMRQVEIEVYGAA